MVFLQNLIHIYHGIATTDQVNIRKWRVVQVIMECKNAGIPDIFIDLVTAIDFSEKLLQLLWGNSFSFTFFIDSASCFRDGYI